MTLRERYHALMADLLEERKATVNTAWAYRLDRKIAQLKLATEEKFGGSGTGD